MSGIVAPPVMDDLDDAIVSLLERDGRLSHRELAEHIGLSRPATAARVARLLASGQVAIRGVVHPAVLRRGSCAHVALTVRGSAARLAAAVADREDVTFVSLCTGRYAVVAEIRAEDQAAIDRAVSRIRALPGVDGLNLLLYSEVVRDVAGPVGEPGVGLDDLDDVDLALLRALQDDGRASYVRLGELVGMSAAGTRRRVGRLIEGRAVRVGAVVRHSGADRRAAMGVGISLCDDGADVVERALGLESVVFLARTLGRYDLVATVNATSAGQLVDLLEGLRALPGVRGIDTWGHLEYVKETYASGRLTADGPPA
ncbi:MAG: Lrp/AsnC family transcriptional regulator [Nocardioides sp.]|uniref:Lrp/AsnC family transcriptional regulator n=1 Tax=Nocardioides sp. TaxID=35761 RepID=UPI0039E546E0